jgi:hypothetical protein
MRRACCVCVCAACACVVFTRVGTSGSSASPPPVMASELPSNSGLALSLSTHCVYTQITNGTFVRVACACAHARVRVSVYGHTHRRLHLLGVRASRPTGSGTFHLSRRRAPCASDAMQAGAVVYTYTCDHRWRDAYGGQNLVGCLVLKAHDEPHTRCCSVPAVPDLVAQALRTRSTRVFGCVPQTRSYRYSGYRAGGAYKGS